MKLVKENIEFERGVEPRDAMSIGLKTKRIFNTPEEIIDWMFRFPEVVTEGEVKEWDYKIRKGNVFHGEDPGKYYYNQLDSRLIRMVKWIKWNLTWVHDQYMGLKEAKGMIDKLKELLINKSQKISESLEFERGIEPKDSMRIGQKALNKQWLDSTKEISGYNIFENMNVAIFIAYDDYLIQVADFKTKSISYQHMNPYQSIKYCFRESEHEFLIISGEDMMSVDTNSGDIANEQLEEVK